MSPAIKPISPPSADTRISYFLRWREMLFVFLCWQPLDLLRHNPQPHIWRGGRKYISSFDLLLPDFTTPNKLASVKRSNQTLTWFNPTSWVSDGHCSSRAFWKNGFTFLLLHYYPSFVLINSASTQFDSSPWQSYCSSRV